MTAAFAERYTSILALLEWRGRANFHLITLPLSYLVIPHTNVGAHHVIVRLGTFLLKFQPSQCYWTNNAKQKLLKTSCNQYSCPQNISPCLFVSAQQIILSEINQFVLCKYGGHFCSNPWAQITLFWGEVFSWIRRDAVPGGWGPWRCETRTRGRTSRGTASSCTTCHRPRLHWTGNYKAHSHVSTSNLLRCSRQRFNVQNSVHFEVFPRRARGEAFLVNPK